MLGMILPAGVESEERFGKLLGGVLFPEEEKVIAHAVQARRREYAAVRSCAEPASSGWATRRFRSCRVSAAPR